jgi:hypothetical protein
MGVHLPGTPRARPVIKDDVDDVVTVSSRLGPVLDQAILDALTSGPLMKWELRVQLHEQEPRLFKHLKALLNAGRIKAFGPTRVRRYALREWEETEPTRDRPPIHRPTTADLIPSTSWWINIDSREAFTHRLEAELPRMTRSAVLASIRPMMLGGKLP